MNAISIQASAACFEGEEVAFFGYCESARSSQKVVTYGQRGV